MPKKLRFKNDFSKRDPFHWELLESINETHLFSVEELKLFPSTRSKSKIRFIGEAINLAQEKNFILGQLQAEKILREKKKIPVSWRKYLIIFTGTCWGRGPDSNPLKYFPCLKWTKEEGWHLGLKWINQGFSENGRILIPRK